MIDIKSAFQNGKAFIPFVTAGDPDLETTEKLLIEMSKNGADIIEIGIPFSDPIAEGVVIQEADLRSLSAGTTTDKIFDMVKCIRPQIDAVLAADARIDTPQQRRRDESEFHTAHVGRCGESRHIGNDTASDRQHESRAVHAQLDETAVDHLDGLHRLDALAQADQHGVVLRQHRMVQPVDRGVGDHHHAPLGERSGENVGHRTYENFALLANVEGRFHYLTF